MKMFNVEYQQIEFNDKECIEVLSGDFKGLIYTYGCVSFVDKKDGNMAIKFEYFIEKDIETDYNKEDLVDTTGNILKYLIEVGLKDNSLVYRGGVDEDRAEDSSKSITE